MARVCGIRAQEKKFSNGPPPAGGRAASLARCRGSAMGYYIGVRWIRIEIVLLSLIASAGAGEKSLCTSTSTEVRYYQAPPSILLFIKYKIILPLPASQKGE